jgi:hypothetical protein
MTNESSSPTKNGTGRAYIINRLKRAGHVDWLQAIQDGKVSAFAVAVTLGWAKRPPTRSGARANQAKRRHHVMLAEERLRISDGRDLQPNGNRHNCASLTPDELTSDQRTFLLYGPDDRVEHAFDTESQVEAAWQRHRDVLLACCQPGRRPWGWRVFDRPEIRWVDYEHEQALNWRAGNVLTPEEKIQVETMWREDFERGRDLKSVPRELVRQWKKAQRQQKEKPPVKSLPRGLSPPRRSHERSTL